LLVVVALNWTIFQSLWTTLMTPVQGVVNQTAGALSNYVVQPFQVFVVVYLVGMLLVAANSGDEDAVMRFFRKIWLAGIIYFVVVGGTVYNDTVTNLLLNTLPTEIGNIISGTTGGALQVANFDDLWNKGFAAGLVIYKNIGWSFKSVGLCIVVVAYWLLGAAAVGVAFFIYLAAHMIAELALAIGPLFVCCYIFPLVRGMFDGWLGVCLSAIVTQLLSILLLSVLIRASQQMIASLSVLNDGNEITGIQILICLVILFGICAYLALQLTRISVAIAGGVSHGAEAVSARIYGLPGTTGSMMNSGYGAARDMISGARDLLSGGGGEAKPTAEPPALANSNNSPGRAA
jgi:type IV secretion system protein VirB6